MVTSTQQQAQGIEFTCLICPEATPTEWAAIQWTLVNLAAERESE